MHTPLSLAVLLASTAAAGAQQITCAPNCDASERLDDAITLQRALGYTALALVVAGLFIAIVVWRRRERIAAAAGDVVVGALASGLKAARKVKKRVQDRAHEP